MYLSLLQKPPQYMLLCWVALVRATDADLPHEERHRCPFPWCDAVFPENQLMELVNHVSACPKMSHGAYVCPYHHKVEMFMSVDSHSEHRGRRHFFKHAFDAICKLGTKGIKKAIHPSKAGSKVEFKTGKKRMRSSPDVHEDTASHLMLPELPGNDAAPAEEADPIMAPPQLPSRVPRQNTTELPTTRSRYFEMEAMHPVVETPVAELASQRMSRLTTSDNIPSSGSNSDFTTSPVSPISSNHWLDAADFASPISPDVTSFPSRPWSSLGASNQVPEVAQPTQFVTPHQLDATAGAAAFHANANNWTIPREPSPPRSFPKIRIDTACTPPSPPPFDATLLAQSDRPLRAVPSPLQIDSDTRNPTKLVEELRGLFHQLFKLSCAKIKQPPLSPAGAALFRMNPTSAHIFEKGCKSLSKIVKGVLPTTFWEVFGLAHLAYAATLAEHEPDLLGLLPEIYEDVARWAEAIKVPQDRRGYLDLVQQLFTAEAPSVANLALEGRGREAAKRSRRATYDTAANTSLEDLNRLWSTSWAPGQHERAAQPQSQAQTGSTLLLKLRQGVIVQLCFRYLGCRCRQHYSFCCAY